MKSVEARLMKHAVALLIVSFLASMAAGAQGVVGDLLAGKLVNPKVGQWAWYDLVAGKDHQKFVVRQAIVGEEKLDRKKGYWVEFEVIPEVGYKIVYKMLLTGPASDPKNIVRVIEKSGPDPAVELNVSAAEAEAAGDQESEAKRKSLGIEEIRVLDGGIRAEHFEVTDGARKMDVWINEKIYPTGVVKMTSLDGQMVLRNHGEGGEYARSVITETPITPEEAVKEHGPVSIPNAPEVETHAGAGAEPKTN